SWLCHVGTWSLPISVTSGPVPVAAAANLSATCGQGIHSSLTSAPVCVLNSALSSSMYLAAAGLLSPRRQTLRVLPAFAGPEEAAAAALGEDVGGASLDPQAASPRPSAAVVTVAAVIFAILTGFSLPGCWPTSAPG